LQVGKVPHWTGGHLQPVKSGTASGAHGGSPSGHAPLQAGKALVPQDGRGSVVVVVVVDVAGAHTILVLVGCTARLPNWSVTCTLGSAALGHFTL